MFGRKNKLPSMQAEVNFGGAPQLATCDECKHRVELKYIQTVTVITKNHHQSPVHGYPYAPTPHHSTKDYCPLHYKNYTEVHIDDSGKEPNKYFLRLQGQIPVTQTGNPIGRSWLPGIFKLSRPQRPL